MGGLLVEFGFINLPIARRQLLFWTCYIYPNIQKLLSSIAYLSLLYDLYFSVYSSDLKSAERLVKGRADKPPTQRQRKLAVL